MSSKSDNVLNSSQESFKIGSTLLARIVDISEDTSEIKLSVLGKLGYIICPMVGLDGIPVFIQPNR